MPRRRIPNVSVPRRPDRRRSGGNATDAQHPPRRRGENETIAERRVLALELRKAAARTARLHSSSAWMFTPRTGMSGPNSLEKTVERAEELRELELQRFR